MRRATHAPAIRDRNGRWLALPLLLCSLLLVSATGRAQGPEGSAPAGQAAPAAGAHAAPAASPTPAEAGPTGVEHAAPAAHGEGGPHHESVWGPISRLVNFLVLAGALVYFFRAPFHQYLADRHTQVRADLEAAAEMKRAATAQLAEVEQRLKALPGEIEALKRHGAEEIAAEERRIKAAAEAEHERLLEQTRRELDVRLRVAHRELVEHAANLAVELATERVRQTVTPADQARLVQRYLEQVRR